LRSPVSRNILARSPPCQRRDPETTALATLPQPSLRRRPDPTGAREAADTAGEDGLFVNSVEKAFRVLDAFGRGASSLGLSEIAAASGLDRSAAQRFAHTLERLGYLRKDPRTRHYELTVRTLDLGYRYIRASTLVDRAAPYLLDLSRATEEAVSLTVLDGTEIVYLSRLLSRHMLHTNVQVGSRLPAWCTAPGRAMLSRLPPAQARALLERSDRIAYTPHTTTTLPVLLAGLEEAAANGFALAVQEIYLADVSVAAAVLGPDGLPCAAVNIAASLSRCPPEAAVERFAPLVITAAAALSRSMPREARR
jgi:IclR family pca regulon transcriptional regulator